MTQADQIIYGTLLVLGVLVTLMAIAGIRGARRAESASRGLTVEALRRMAGNRLPQGGFLWGVWLEWRSPREQRLRLADATGAPVAEIVYHAVPRDGVLQSFTLEDRQYECIREGWLSSVSQLREARSGEILLCCRHGTLRSTYGRTAGGQALFEVRHGAVFKGYSAVMRDGAETGRLSTLNLPSCPVLVLTSGDPPLSRLEQCFVLANLPRSR